ncbi:glycosyltransferase family 2 protein [Priestia megaterium]|uniref:glycosyltransferase family 2 protein n=1 Tax=Priestia megaterium TaxID=1404 RepID=UPI002EA8D0BD|nr:glycosyltransferase family 2 protein [Priestia megaterium]
MLDLTVIILTKNEEANIKKCIDSFNGIVKRFVIVDSYSTDRTKEICEELDLDFYERKFDNHASQFNWALENTNINTEWVMRMDADEELTPELSLEIENRLKLLPSNINGIILKRRVYFMGKWIKRGGVYPQCLLRIFRNRTAVCEQKVMDEHIILLSGESMTFKSDLIDNNTKDLDWWTNKHNWYSNKEVEEYYNTQKLMTQQQEVKPSLFRGQAERKRWIKNFLYYKIPLFQRPKWYFFYRYIIRLGFLDGKEGLVFHFLQGYWYRFLVDSKIYESQQLGKIVKTDGDLK